MKTSDLDSLKTFKSLKQKYPEAFLFETTDLTIIGLNYDEVLRLVGGQVTRTQDELTQILEVNFLEYLSGKLKSFEKTKGSFPYEHGGAFGCLGYEIVSMLEPKLKQAGYFNDLSTSNEVLAEIFFSKNLIIFDHSANKVHFALSSLMVTFNELVAKDQFTVAAPIVIAEEFKNTTALMGEEKFYQNVKQIKAHIKL